MNQQAQLHTYVDFWTGLEASTAKIEEYYKRSADCYARLG